MQEYFSERFVVLLCAALTINKPFNEAILMPLVLLFVDKSQTISEIYLRAPS